jgi:hypothetical protein
MPAGDADLLFDQVEIVQQPFACGRDASSMTGRGGQSFAGVDEYGFVVAQPGQQQVAALIRAQPMLAGEHLAVPLHLVGAEQFRAQGRLLLWLGASSCASTTESAQAAQFEQIECAADVQCPTFLRVFK